MHTVIILCTHVHTHSSVRVWDVHNGKLQHTLIGHTEEIEVSISHSVYIHVHVTVQGGSFCAVRRIVAHCRVTIAL